MSLKLLHLAAAALLAQLMIAGPVRADPPSSAIIVFDGSGSVWGRMDPDKRAKYEVARDALRQTLSTLPKGSRLGLVAFGHRRRGDCADVETAVAPAEGNNAAIDAVLEKFNPRGRGPVVAAIREAVKSAGASSASSIIVIQDGADNCQQDACQAGADIAKSNPGLAVHVIGMAMEPGDIARVSCMAKATGGTFSDARDAATLTTAIDQTLKLALHATEPDTFARGTAGSTVDPGKAASSAGPPGIQLSAALAEGGSQLKSAVTWRISTSGTNGEIVRELSASDAFEALPPGSYRIEARIGSVRADQIVEVNDQGPTMVQLTLNAGLLVVKNANAIDDRALLTVYNTDTDEAGTTPSGRPAWIGRVPKESLVLGAGSYRLALEDGHASAERTVKIAAGARIETDLKLPAGSLVLDAVAQAGGEPLKDVVFLVFVDDPDAPQGRREVARSAAPAPTFSLAPGTYYVTAIHGLAEIRQRIAVGAGEAVRKTVVLDAAKLKATAVYDKALVNGKEPLIFRVVRLDGEPKEMARSGIADPEFTLPAGRYRIEAFLGAQNAKSIQDVSLAPGSFTAANLQLDAAAVSFKLSEAAKLQAGPYIFWEIRDSAGASILKTSLTEPNAVLQPGRYSVKAQMKSGNLENTFQVNGGERRIVELSGN